MKITYTCIAFFIAVLSSFGQVPQNITYQAVVRDNSEILVLNSTTPIQISVVETTAAGTAVYVETHIPTTNANGLLNIQIGTGTVVSGTFSAIDWSSNAHFIKTEIDVDNNASYDVTKTSKIVSVPYALHAKTTQNATETQTLAGVIALGNSVHARLKNVTNPTDAQDAATKNYVDAIALLLAALETRTTALE